MRVSWRSPFLAAFFGCAVACAPRVPAVEGEPAPVPCTPETDVRGEADAPPGDDGLAAFAANCHDTLSFMEWTYDGARQ